ncbi:class I SAM-dependent methyltransferase [Algihabitans albus]|uniref:class I SAM-dependent methyltransferase n=1 Tax=Algihabitans albus TaxID=2164067 RepID=UPI000E5C79E0|nr:class I SAM-dependent methyltransferase [Algihabitans albus]
MTLASALAPTLNCPCDGRHLVPAFAYEAPPQGETVFDLEAACYRRAYRSCALCGHWFGAHALDLSRLYDGSYVDATYGGPAGMADKLRQILALPPERSDNGGRVRWIEGQIGRSAGRRLLDVGAGLGVFPAAMKARGWRVFAVETDSRTVAHLCDAVGIEAFAKDLTLLTAEELGGPVDLVSFNKVLEHVEAPLPLLSHAAELLTETGVCYLELPDVAAAAEGPGREEFFIEHHHVFSPASLVLLAERAGFSLTALERLREPSGKFTLRALLTAGTGA